MNTQQVDYLNIGLMLISFIIAMIVPFELFLFSYAVLGPIHYLTEIGWLRKQHYFTKKKSDYLWLIGLCALTTLGALLVELNRWDATRGVYTFLNDSAVFSTPMSWLSEYQVAFIFLAFIAALAFTIFNKLWQKIALIAVAVVVSTQIKAIPALYSVFGVFLPTILHVSLFTGAFILYGALKSKKTSSYLSFLAFILFIFSFFIIDVDGSSYTISKYAKETFRISNFDGLTVMLAALFVDIKKLLPFNFNNDLIVRVEAFVAFSYTYHYLNWFSKTSIIKWHQVPKKWIAASLLIWALSVGLYLYNYRIGLFALFFLSMLHVFLEFPLNHRTFIYIGQRLLGRNPDAGKGKGPKSKSKKRNSKGSERILDSGNFRKSKV